MADPINHLVQAIAAGAFSKEWNRLLMEAKTKGGFLPIHDSLGFKLRIVPRRLSMATWPQAVVFGRYKFDPFEEVLRGKEG